MVEATKSVLCGLVKAHQPVVTYLQFSIQVCFSCNDHAQPAADKAAPTSVTDNLVVLVPPQPFYDPFSGTTRVSRCQKRTSGLYDARED